MNKISIVLFLLSGLSNGMAQKVDVDVNLNVKHTVGDVDEFDRSKFVTIHADVIESEWDEGFGANFTKDLRNDFLNGYDVYLGRNTGKISQALHQVKQDANRPGYADNADIEAIGTQSKNDYAAGTNWHPYESRNNKILCTQLHPFWPDGQKTNIGGWALSQENTDANPFGTASGEFFAQYTKNAYGTGGTTGQPKPELLEIINEPLWHLVDFGEDEPIDIFNFHNTVAKEVKKLNSDVQVGGFCTAFPDLDKRNFKQWDERWKLFMDETGDNMDFWTIHLYDFPSIGGKKKYRKGSNMEATFDMMEQYSYLKFGKVKPFMISEYGAQMHDYFGTWSPYRDWLHIVSSNAMMMQFMERANLINQTINFIVIKATWATTGVDDTYNHRLMRRANEPESYDGDWVYSEMIKIYQLWANVKGQRVDSRQSDLDILTDAYVDGNKAYVILSNLAFEERKVKLNLFEDNNLSIESLMVKRVYLKDDLPVLDTLNYTATPAEIDLASEGTIILEYTFSGDVSIDQTSDEVKYYATTYYQPIVKDVNNFFDINGVDVGSYGEATLRLGLGRAHGKSLRPSLYVNDSLIPIKASFRGDNQKDRDSFFGVIEIDVPYGVLKADNDIKITFGDEGGYISSVALQAYKFSKEIKRTTGGPVTGVTLETDSVMILTDSTFQLLEMVVPGNADNSMVEWDSATDTVVSVTGLGLIQGLKKGDAYVYVTTVDGGYVDSCLVTVVDSLPDMVSCEYLPTEIESKENYQFKIPYSAGQPLVITVDLRENEDVWQGGGEQTVQVGTGDIEINCWMQTLPTPGSEVRIAIYAYPVGTDWQSQTTNCSTAGIRVTALPVIGLEVNPIDTIVGVEKYAQLRANVLPAEASVRTVTWMSENKDVVTVNEDGWLKGISEGTVNVIATSDDGGFTDTCVVSVVRYSVTGVEIIAETDTVLVNESLQLEVEVSPETALDKSVVWKSSDSGVATVDGKGMVSGISQGSAKITVITKDGDFQDELLLTVDDATSVLNAFAQSIKLYPNPVNTMLFIDGLGEQELNVDVFNAMGANVINSKLISHSNNSLDVSLLNAGVYIVKLSSETEEASFNIKIVE